jgi:hypothetical protein
MMELAPWIEDAAFLAELVPPTTAAVEEDGSGVPRCDELAEESLPPREEEKGAPPRLDMAPSRCTETVDGDEIQQPLQSNEVAVDED